MNETKDIRWKQRFENFEKAYILLDEVVTDGVVSLSNLEQEGVVQRFGIVIELAWKTLKDYLVHEGYDGVYQHRLLPIGKRSLSTSTKRAMSYQQ